MLSLNPKKKVKEVKEKFEKEVLGGGAGGSQVDDFQPGFAGMPTPPFLMNGPYYSKPYSLTVNMLPFPMEKPNELYEAANIR